MIPPANNLTLTNTTLVGNYQASSTITAETNVVVNGTATLKTPGTIYLKPGFTANSGCKLTISVGAVTSDKYYYLKDHLGSIRVVVDTVGEIVSYSDYDAWGMILNGRSSNFGFADDKYKFTSKERDVETNYDYFGARYYDSRLGRWLQADPLAEKYPGWIPYNYALNNPINNIDPDGKQAINGGWQEWLFRRVVKWVFKKTLREPMPMKEGYGKKGDDKDLDGRDDSQDEKDDRIYNRDEYNKRKDLLDRINKSILEEKQKQFDKLKDIDDKSSKSTSDAKSDNESQTKASDNYEPEKIDFDKPTPPVHLNEGREKSKEEVWK